jgi:alkane 1-monooxygenase
MRATWLRFWAVYVLAGVELWAIWKGLSWFLPFTAFILVPLFDFPESRSRAPLSDGELFRLPLLLWLPVEVSIILFLDWRLATLGRSLTFFGALLWASSLGVVMALGLNVAHELNHKTPLMYRSLARCLLVLCGYGSYAIEHNRGHHKTVGLFEDPATARRGESFYSFFPRSVRGVFGAALKWPQVRGRVLFDTSAYLVLVHLFAYIYAALRLESATASRTEHVSTYLFGAFVYMLASFFSIFQVELVNYIEHYGLFRVAPDKPITAALSWNNHHWLSGCLLFKLEYHSDHHLHAARWYPKLDNRLEEWPQHPAGLPAMMLLALVPPLWRRVMDPRAKCYQPVE